jgi:hypothetical protein
MDDDGPVTQEEIDDYNYHYGGKNDDDGDDDDDKGRDIVVKIEEIGDGDVEMGG